MGRKPQKGHKYNITQYRIIPVYWQTGKCNQKDKYDLCKYLHYFRIHRLAWMSLRKATNKPNRLIKWNGKTVNVTLCIRVLRGLVREPINYNLTIRQCSIDSASTNSANIESASTGSLKTTYRLRQLPIFYSTCCCFLWLLYQYYILKSPLNCLHFFFQ
jgi:hypothetical protein